MASKKKSENGEAQAPRVSAEEFVRTWQGCSTLADAVAKLGKGAGSRAARMRKAKVNLKVMPGGGRKLDVAALNQIIAGL